MDEMGECVIGREDVTPYKSSDARSCVSDSVSRRWIVSSNNASGIGFCKTRVAPRDWACFRIDSENCSDATCPLTAIDGIPLWFNRSLPRSRMPPGLGVVVLITNDHIGDDQINRL